jgi:transcriptional regulator with XRE-family HTH domain
MNLGKAIRLCRKNRHYTQTQLAKLADISVSHLSLMEMNKRDPSLNTVESISKALNVPVSVLVFIAAEREEITELGEEQIEELTLSIMGLMGGASRQQTLF